MTRRHQIVARNFGPSNRSILDGGANVEEGTFVMRLSLLIAKKKMFGFFFCE